MTEQRNTDNKIELREDADKPQIVGYAALFDSLSEDLGGFEEVVRTGAFRKTLQEADIRALWNHNTDKVLGRNRAGTLELTEDETGLSITIDPPEWASDVQETIARGDVDQMSFKFRAIKEKWTSADDRDSELPLRELLEVKLYEVSPTTFPAYENTVVSIRSEDLSSLTEEEKRTILNKPPLARHSVTDKQRKLQQLAEVSL